MCYIHTVATLLGQWLAAGDLQPPWVYYMGTHMGTHPPPWIYYWVSSWLQATSMGANVYPQAQNTKMEIRSLRHL